MQPLNLNEAAKLCHKSKSTVLESIRKGRLSAIRNDKNEWQIDPSELFRVYPFKIESEQTEQQNIKKTERENRNRTKENYKEILEIERAERERERKQFEETISKLWQRLEAETEERQKLTKLLTYQPAAEKKENLLFKKIFKR